MDTLHAPDIATAAAAESLARPLKIAVVGAGPVGLALALLAAQRLPQATVFALDPLQPAEPSALKAKLEAIRAAVAA